MNHRSLAVGLAAALIAGTAACSEDGQPIAPELEPPVLLSVVPQGGATGVDPTTDVVLRFDHPLMSGMEAYIDLHEGSVTGPEVPGIWAMGDDGESLHFSPDAALKPLTDYTVHLGGGMMGTGGQHVNYQSHGPGMGGSWATGGMMQGGMGGSMGDPDSHMGQGWQHPDNGSYGMLFTFTTGS